MALSSTTQSVTVSSGILRSSVPSSCSSAAQTRTACGGAYEHGAPEHGMTSTAFCK